MNLCIESLYAFVHCKTESMDALIDRLERKGYEPLIRKAGNQFAAVFGGTADDMIAGKSEEEEEEGSRDFEEVRRKLIGLEKLGYSWGMDNLRGFARVPDVKGEIFYSDDHTGILFISMVEAGMKHDGAEHVCTIRVGFIGDSSDNHTLSDFATAVSKGMEELGFEMEWNADDLRSRTFDELGQLERESNLQPGSSVNEREIRAAKILENSSVREVATLVRRSGVMLAKELLRQKAEQASDIIRYVDQLLQVNVLHQEYVVVCQKSGAHVNRVESRDVIDQMARLGVLCSCGKPISEEQIEGLLASDPLLPRMLDNNYWMASTVVRLLGTMGVPANRILVDVAPSGEDVEMFADIEGTLVMFELKDAEYGLNNAYSLGARIGMHRPQVAFVVSTKGIASEVKDHFKRIKPETKMVYVANLIQLEATLKKIVENVRLMKVRTWLSLFEGMLEFPIVPLIVPKLQSSTKFEIPHVVTSVQMQETASAPAARERETDPLAAR